jgi:CBS domain-containing protein
MATAQAVRKAGRLFLKAETAADLMTPSLVSISASSLVRDAVELFTEKGFSAAPVIDDAGRPVGVISRTDVLIHDRARLEYMPEESEPPRHGRHHRSRAPEGDLQVVNVDRTTVAEMMTPAVFAVTPETPVAKVLEEMLALHVHQIYVVDGTGVLTGVITPLDVLRALHEDR